MAAAKFLELVRTDDRRPGTLSLLGGVSKCVSCSRSLLTWLVPSKPCGGTS